MQVTFEDYIRSNAGGSNFGLRTYVQTDGTILCSIYPIDGTNVSGCTYKVNRDQLEYVPPKVADNHFHDFPVTPYPEFLG